MEYGNFMFFFSKKGLHYSDVFKPPPPGDKGRFSWNFTFLNIREFYFFFSMSYALGQDFFSDFFFPFCKSNLCFKKELKKIMSHLKVKHVTAISHHAQRIDSKYIKLISFLALNLLTSFS